MGFGHVRRAPLISESASVRCRSPPTTSSAAASNWHATGESPSTPSSPMPMMLSHRCAPQGVGSADLSRIAMRVLILGGTTEGYALADALARDSRFAATYSLAGRTKTPLLPRGATRVGGFGGAQGLIDWMRGEKIDTIVDATHPYAARISANAVVAADALRMPLLRLQRAAWVRAAGDDWREVPDANAAVTALGPQPRNVFLTIGRTEVAAF